MLHWLFLQGIGEVPVQSVHSGQCDIPEGTRHFAVADALQASENVAPPPHMPTLWYAEVEEEVEEVD